jgi:hypothetical protein
MSGPLLRDSAAKSSINSVADGQNFDVYVNAKRYKRLKMLVLQ